MMKKLFYLFIFFSTASKAQSHTADRLQLAAQMETSINTELLNKWYPKCVDSIHGGFLSAYTFDLNPPVRRTSLL
jgi:mannobiose 2-epimerase